MKKLTFILLAISTLCACKTDNKKSNCCNSVPQSTEQISNIEPESSGSSSTGLHTQIAWGRQFGDSSINFGKSLGVDSENNVYMSGWTNGAFARKGFGGFDIYILKLNNLGEIIWKKQFGSDKDEHTEEITVDKDGNTTIAGWTKGNFAGKIKGGKDIIVAQYDKDGNEKWAKQFGTDSIDDAQFIEQDINGNIYVSGYTAGNFASENLGKRDAVLIKLDPKGNVIFKSQLGTDKTDIGQGVHFDSEGNIFLCGASGGFWDEPNPDSIDVFLAKLDPSGKLLWQKNMGTPLGDLATAIKVDKDDNLIIGGSTSGNYGGKQAGWGDAFIGKFDNEGNKIWLQQFGREKWDGVMNIEFARDGSNDFVISGCQNWDQCEGFCRRYTTNGKLIWVQQFAGDGEGRSSCGKDVTIDSENSIYHCGGTNTSMFAKNQGDINVYVVKFRENKP